MLDRRAQALVAPLLRRLAAGCVRIGLTADALTWTGFAIGIAAAAAIALQAPLLGLALIGVSRLCDGLDGAVARLTHTTDRGAFLDIALDFVFYASIPLAFAVADPAANALASAVLLAAYIGTGSSFLAFAVFAQQRGLRSTAFPNKGLYYLGGLTEATETYACYALMCLVPQHYAWWAYGFAALCALTAGMRIAHGAAVLARPL